MMKRLTRAVLIAAIVAAEPASLFAADGGPNPNAFSDRALRAAINASMVRSDEPTTTLAPPSKRTRTPDSPVAGMLIGALVGGVGGSAAIVLAHGGSENFRVAMLNVAPLTALCGGIIGAVVDAVR